MTRHQHGGMCLNIGTLGELTKALEKLNESGLTVTQMEIQGHNVWVRKVPAEDHPSSKGHYEIIGISGIEKPAPSSTHAHRGGEYPPPVRRG